MQDYSGPREYRETPRSRISCRAKFLLRRDYPDEASQWSVVRWAEDEFNRLGLWPVGRLDEFSPENLLFNLISENILLDDWMRARTIGERNVLKAEDFRDLIDRLTPAYGDR